MVFSIQRFDVNYRARFTMTMFGNMTNAAVLTSGQVVTHLWGEL